MAGQTHTRSISGGDLSRVVTQSNFSLHHFCLGFCVIVVTLSFFYISRSIQGPCGRRCHHLINSLGWFCCIFLSPHFKKTKSKKETHNHVVASCVIRMTHHSTSFNRNIQRMKTHKNNHYQSSCLAERNGKWTGSCILLLCLRKLHTLNFHPRKRLKPHPSYLLSTFT